MLTIGSSLGTWAPPRASRVTYTPSARSTPRSSTRPVPFAPTSKVRAGTICSSCWSHTWYTRGPRSSGMSWSWSVASSPSMSRCPLACGIALSIVEAPARQLGWCVALATRLALSASLALDHLHQRCLQAGRRLELLHGPRQRVGRRAQPRELLLALAATAQVPLEGLALEVVQRAEEVRADVVLMPCVIGHATPSTSCRLILSRPSRIRPFTVPSGSSISRAISFWV